MESLRSTAQLGDVVDPVFVAKEILFGDSLDAVFDDVDMSPCLSTDPFGAAHTSADTVSTSSQSTLSTYAYAGLPLPPPMMPPVTPSTTNSASAAISAGLVTPTSSLFDEDPMADFSMDLGSSAFDTQMSMSAADDLFSSFPVGGSTSSIAQVSF